MGFISAIVNFFGCSGQKDEGRSALSKEIQAQIASSIESFKNRPILEHLTEQIIDTTSDENLLHVVFDNLSLKQPKDYTKVYDTVLSWNKSRQAIYMIWLLEAEVNNGGYNQFYANSSGQFYKEMPGALTLVGAMKFADLTRRVNNIYESENDKITKHQDGTLEGFSKSYEDNPLNKFDDEFYDLYKSENLHQLQIDFIRKNKRDFY